MQSEYKTYDKGHWRQRLRFKRTSACPLPTPDQKTRGDQAGMQDGGEPSQGTPQPEQKTAARPEGGCSDAKGDTNGKPLQWTAHLEPFPGGPGKTHGVSCQLQRVYRRGACTGPLGPSARVFGSIHDPGDWKNPGIKDARVSNAAKLPFGLDSHTYKHPQQDYAKHTAAVCNKGKVKKYNWRERDVQPKRESNGVNKLELVCPAVPLKEKAWMPQKIMSFSGLLDKDGRLLEPEKTLEVTRLFLERTTSGKKTKQNWALKTEEKHEAPKAADVCHPASNTSTSQSLPTDDDLSVLMEKNHVSLPPNCTTKLQGIKFVDGKKHLILKVIPPATQGGGDVPPDMGSHTIITEPVEHQRVTKTKCVDLPSGSGETGLKNRDDVQDEVKACTDQTNQHELHDVLLDSHMDTGTVNPSRPEISLDLSFTALNQIEDATPEEQMASTDPQDGSFEAWPSMICQAGSSTMQGTSVQHLAAEADVCVESGPDTLRLESHPNPSAQKQPTIKSMTTLSCCQTRNDPEAPYSTNQPITALRILKPLTFTQVNSESGSTAEVDVSRATQEGDTDTLTKRRRGPCLEDTSAPKLRKGSSPTHSEDPARGLGSRHAEKSLVLWPLNSTQPVKRPQGNQPVVVLNHPDSDIAEVANIMRVVNKHKSDVLKVRLSQRTVRALSDRNTGSMARAAAPHPTNSVKERFLLKLKFKKLGKNKYQVVRGGTLQDEAPPTFRCWFCGRIFTSQELFIGHGQRHLMEATKDWDTLYNS
ncbi:uncharacterized protein znf518a [Denticeps clupeoides]|uniref:C2H2-type domain-containing protein n=1 Tax=Denticeps clupeoides TaxID=299321 RepID=A0AAY4EKP9_9TELE|nr:uncharacterized protein LOC114795467 [Denticeps clupeoides]